MIEKDQQKNFSELNIFIDYYLVFTFFKFTFSIDRLESYLKKSI